ncbi:MAG TPA: hypothetical protein VNO43_18980, partial [Candidatus Eisenbacteria bacterium]|nr:hypothetical protein [Candidatus Eisenbacteria bacterium]
FHIIHQPTYMSKYPPAQGLALAIGQILAGHPIVGVWMSFGLMCAAIGWMLYAWMPPRWALFGGVLAIINPMLGITSYWAQSYWGGAIAAGGGALVLGGVHRLMRRSRMSEGLLTGAGLVVLANSRPYEGLLLSLAAGAVLLAWMLSARGPSLAVSLRRIVMPMCIVLILAGTAMGLYNFGVTGDPFRLPYQVHEETYAVAPIFIWQDLRPEPVYRHQRVRDFHADYVPLYVAQRSLSGFMEKNIGFIWNWVKFAFNVFAIPFVAAFYPLTRWASRSCWVRWWLVAYVVFLFGLMLSVVTAVHYAAPITGLNYFFVLTAMRLWRRRHKRAGRCMLWVVPCLALAVLVLEAVSGMTKDNLSAWYLQRARLLAQLSRDESRHLIIVKYGPHHSVNDEWVYNGAEIDRAKVVWARGMDPAQNCKLTAYFNDRRIWLLEVGTGEPSPKLEPYSTDVCRRQSA